MAAVKNIGYKAASIISKHRDDNGLYSTIFDLCSFESHVINRKVLESLIQAGACDDLDGSRSQLFYIIDTALRWGQKHNEENTKGQENLFLNNNSDFSSTCPPIPKIADWTHEECLIKKKACLDFIYQATLWKNIKLILLNFLT